MIKDNTHDNERKRWRLRERRGKAESSLLRWEQVSVGKWQHPPFIVHSKGRRVSALWAIPPLFVAYRETACEEQALQAHVREHVKSRDFLFLLARERRIVHCAIRSSKRIHLLILTQDLFFHSHFFGGISTLWFIGSIQDFPRPWR